MTIGQIKVVFVVSLGEAFVRQLGVNNLLGGDGDWVVHIGGALLLVVVLGGKKFYKSCMSINLAHSLVVIQDLFQGKLPALATSSVDLGLWLALKLLALMGTLMVKVRVIVKGEHGGFN